MEYDIVDILDIIQNSICKNYCSQNNSSTKQAIFVTFYIVSPPASLKTQRTQRKNIISFLLRGQKRNDLHRFAIVKPKDRTFFNIRLYAARLVLEFILKNKKIFSLCVLRLR